MRWMLVIGFGLVVVVIIVTAGVYIGRRVEHADVELSMVPLTFNASYTVTTTIEAEQVSTGQPLAFVVNVTSAGTPADLFSSGRMVHFVLASANQADIFHTYELEERKPGQYVIERTLTQPGLYRLWIEIDNTHALERHGEHAELIAAADFTVTGASLPSPLAPTNIQMSALQLHHEVLHAGSAMELTWHAHDETNALLPLYEAEPALYVLIGPNLDFFRHGHVSTLRNDTDAVLPVTLPTPGNYVLWTETYAPREDRYETITDIFHLTVD